jgi:hypothetical protein
MEASQKLAVAERAMPLALLERLNSLEAALPIGSAV